MAKYRSHTGHVSIANARPLYGQSDPPSCQTHLCLGKGTQSQGDTRGGGQVDTPSGGPGLEALSEGEWGKGRRKRPSVGGVPGWVRSRPLLGKGQQCALLHREPHSHPETHRLPRARWMGSGNGQTPRLRAEDGTRGCVGSLGEAGRPGLLLPGLGFWHSQQHSLSLKPSP